MEKINIAEILKDCPMGTLLYATVHGEVKLSRITSSENYPIEVELDSGEDLFTKDGRIYPNKGECVLFPSKDQRDWSKFQRPFKDGDIVVTTLNNIAIIKEPIGTGYSTYTVLFNNFLYPTTTEVGVARLATEEEKQELFRVIKENGYKWNAENKTLEKLVAPNKFDITTLEPFTKVLARDNVGKNWHVDFFSNLETGTEFPYKCIGDIYRQCIPYEDNKHLWGTINDCSDYYKTWK